LDLAGLKAFEDAVALKLLDFLEVKVSDLSAISAAAGIAGKDALRLRKLLTNPAAREAVIKERQERKDREQEHHEAELREKERIAAAEAQQKRDIEAAEAASKREAEASKVSSRVEVSALLLFVALLF
jgi:hypothetical protein